MTASGIAWAVWPTRTLVRGPQPVASHVSQGRISPSRIPVPKQLAHADSIEATLHSPVASRRTVARYGNPYPTGSDESWSRNTALRSPARSARASPPSTLSRPRGGGAPPASSAFLNSPDVSAQSIFSRAARASASSASPLLLTDRFSRCTQEPQSQTSVTRRSRRRPLPARPPRRNSHRRKRDWTRSESRARAPSAVRTMTRRRFSSNAASCVGVSSVPGTADSMKRIPSRIWSESQYDETSRNPASSTRSRRSSKVGSCTDGTLLAYAHASHTNLGKTTQHARRTVTWRRSRL